MKTICALILSLLSGPALAQFDCLPKEYGGTGIYLVISYDTLGRSAGWLCPGSGPTPPQDKVNTFTRLNSPGVLPTCNTTLNGALDAILTAHKPLDAANAMLKDCGFKPAAGTAAASNFEALRQTSIRAVQSLYAADNPPAGPVWKTPAGGSAIYPVVNGKLGVPTGRRAPGNALCDCAVLKVTVSTYTYCALSGGPSTEAVLAVKASP